MVNYHKLVFNDEVLNWIEVLN